MTRERQRDVYVIEYETLDKEHVHYIGRPDVTKPPECPTSTYNGRLDKVKQI